MPDLKKIFLSILLFFVFSSFNSYAEIVKKVKIQGNERISPETIMVFGDIIVGKNYEIPDVNSLIKKLYNTSFFSDISAEIKNNVLTIVVKENPVINEIEFQGEKASKYKEKLREFLLLRENGAFVQSNIKTDINLIKEFYRSMGFYFVKIDAEVAKLDKNRVNLSFNIEKGDKAKIAKIYFLGDKKIRDRRFRT